jgi:D-alanyl-D-alanine dipeptidase
MTLKKIMIGIAAELAAFFCATAFVRPALASEAYPPGFVSLLDMIPDASLDIRYFGENNFVGERIASYNAPEAIMTVEAAAALKRAARDLAGRGYGVKIFDAYRPRPAVEHFVRWGRDPGDVRMKAIFYPDTEKAELFKRGYISSRSAHSRGSTVDLTLTRLAGGAEVDMGSPFDFFGEISHFDSRLATEEQSANRRILRDAMTKAGFKPVKTEWWHFTLADDPRPSEYFDFPVALPPLVGGAEAAYLDEVSGGSVKVITVAQSGKSVAVVRAYRKTDDGWRRLFETGGFLGRGGVAADKREGDGATPEGIYAFGRAFGAADDPGSTLAYTKLSSRDLWVDDPASARYNQWAKADSPDADWKSAERLSAHPVAYKYAASINYNTDPVVPGRGSAIFLHCATGRPTEGCVAVSEASMVFLLTFIDDETRVAITRQSGK